MQDSERDDELKGRGDTERAARAGSITGLYISCQLLGLTAPLAPLNCTKRRTTSLQCSSPASVCISLDLTNNP